MPDVIVFYGTSWCGDCRMAKRILDEYGIHYEYLDIDVLPEARKKVEQINHGMQIVPTILFPDGSILVEPSADDLKKKIQKSS